MKLHDLGIQNERTKTSINLSLVFTDDAYLLGESELIDIQIIIQAILTRGLFEIKPRNAWCILYAVKCSTTVPPKTFVL